MCIEGDNFKIWEWRREQGVKDLEVVFKIWEEL